MRDDATLGALFERVDRFVDSLDVKIMAAPQRRTKKVPRRLEQQSVTALDAALDEKSFLRRQAIEAIDLISNELIRSSDQPGLRLLIDIEELLLRCPKDITEVEIGEKLGQDVRDVNVGSLSAQLTMLKKAASPTPFSPSHSWHRR